MDLNHYSHNPRQVLLMLMSNESGLSLTRFGFDKRDSFAILIKENNKQKERLA